MDKLVQIEENRAWREWEKEMKEEDERTRKEKLEREEAERRIREQEAESRKKEQELLLTRMKDDHEKLLGRMNSATPPASGRARKRSVSPSPSTGGRGSRGRGARSPSPLGDPNYFDKLRSGKKPKKQVAVSPVDPTKWTTWIAGPGDVTKIRHHVPTADSKEILGEGLAEVAEYLDGMPVDQVGTKSVLKRMYKDEIGEDPLARWSRLDIIVGFLGHILSR